MNISCPINNTGYGVASLNIIKCLHDLHPNISFFPIGQPGVDNEKDYLLLNKLINNNNTFDYNAPYLKIWHQFDLSSHIGKGKYYAYPFFELDTFDIREKIHLSVPDCIFVSSSCANDVLISNGIKSEIKIAPLGVDTQIFDYKKFIEEWTDYGIYLAHPSKNFSVEKDVPIDYRILQQKTKCFSCERELFAHNPQSIYLGAPTKCFSCERQFIR